MNSNHRVRRFFAAALLSLSVSAWDPLQAADDVVIAPPLSDVVSSARPYVITVSAGSRVAAEKGTAAVVLRRAEPGLREAALATESVEFQLPRVEAAASPKVGSPLEKGGKPDASRVAAITVDVSTLAEGEYAGQIAITLGEVKNTKEFHFFRVPEGRAREFPFGIYATPFGKTAEEHEAVLSALHECGINLICQHMSGMGDMAPVYDRAARLGMTYMPSINSCGWGVQVTDAMKGRLTSGVMTRLPCLNNPAIRQGAARMLSDWLREHKAHPAFSGYVYYGDDFALETKRRKDGGIDIACYCDFCKKDFKEKTGKEIPSTYEAKTGIVPADDLLLQWMRYRSSDLYNGFMLEMHKAKNSVDPAIQIGSIHGWSEVPFVCLASAVYAPLSQSANDVVSSYCYPELVSPRMDFIGQYEIAKMGARQKDVWMLGELGVFSFMDPPWMVRQNYWNMLAAGYKVIGFFSWWDYAQALQKGKKEEAAAAVAALTECGKHKDWILPVAALWQEPEARNAVLYSFTTDAFEIMPVYHGGDHQEDILAFYREALRQHVPLKIVSEEEIRSGMLKQLDSLCLYNVRALPEDVYKVIEKYAAGTGTVYVPDGSKIRVKGAQQAACDTMIALIHDKSAPPVEIGDRNVTFREFRSGDGRYYVFVNNSCDLFWGMNCSWGNMEATYRDARKVRDKPIQTVAEFRDRGFWLFDLSTGDMVGKTDDPLALKLDPSWGKVFAALPARKVSLRLSGEDRVKQGETARFKVAMLDQGSKQVSGAFAVRVAIETPSGRKSRYSGFIGVKDGAGEFVLPIGRNDEIGKWKLSFEGGFPRKQVRATLRVVEGDDLSMKKRVS